MRSSRPAIPAPTAPHRVAARGKGHTKRGGTRGRGRVTDQIHRIARDRQAAWAETNQPTVTLRLTRELDELYDDHRKTLAGTLTGPYAGRTSGACQ